MLVSDTPASVHVLNLEYWLEQRRRQKAAAAAAAAAMLRERLRARLRHESDRDFSEHVQGDIAQEWPAGAD